MHANIGQFRPVIETLLPLCLCLCLLLLSWSTTAWLMVAAGAGCAAWFLSKYALPWHRKAKRRAHFAWLLREGQLGSSKEAAPRGTSSMHNGGGSPRARALSHEKKPPRDRKSVPREQQSPDNGNDSSAARRQEDEEPAGMAEEAAAASAAASAAKPRRACPHCGRVAGTVMDDGKVVKLRRCTGCMRVRYCSEECLQAAWDAGHRDECKRLRAAAQQG